MTNSYRSAGITENEDRTARDGSTDMTKVETGLQEVDLLTQQKWRQDCERWIY